MPRFVILKHDHPTLHWDFMLQSGGVLRTWRLERPPELGAVISATPIADHRIEYLDYEGEVSGGRGRVTRWDAGEFDWRVDSPRAIEVLLRGGRAAGRVHLIGDESGDWSFMLTSSADSVESDRTEL